MKTFDRYLIREWLQTILLVLSALLGLLLVQLMYDNLPTLLRDGAKFEEILLFFGISIPAYLAILLPLTLLVSLLYVLGQMHRQHEFTALRAAGISIARITTPIWIIGLFCCALTWWLNSTIVPASTEEAQRLEERLSYRKQTGAIPLDRVGAFTGVSFDNRQEGRMWFINRYSTYMKRAYGVHLSFVDAKRRETSRLFAAQAWPLPKGKGWHFGEGREITFNAETGEVLSNQPFLEKELRDIDEDPDLMLLIDRKPVDLSFYQLQRIIAHLEETGNPKVTAYAVRYETLLTDTVAPLIIIGLAIPFAMTGVRVNPAVGISKSIGLFALYFLLGKVSESLAIKGVLSPLMAAWLPNLGMAGLAAWLFRRMR